MKQIRHITALLALLLALPATGLIAQKTGNNGVSVSHLGCQLYIPNAFTPNGDHINDRFEVQPADNCRLIKFQIRIYDRWGQLVYQSNTVQPDEAWDGTSEGRKMAKGVYMYDVYAILEMPDKPDETQEIKERGSVVLMR